MLKVLLCTLLMLLVSVSAFARNHVWYDKSAGISGIKKVVVFPIEGYKNFATAEDVWKDLLSSRAKNIHFTLLQPDNQQVSMLIEQNEEYLSLLQEFSSEEQRAKAVKEKTGADAYLLCRIRENRVQRDWSPETSCYVTIREYTEESGGPSGYRTYDESTYTRTHVVPGQYVYLSLLNLEYCLYDNQGRKIMLVTNRTQGYNTNEETQFRDLLKEFAKEFKIATKDKGK